MDLLTVAGLIALLKDQPQDAQIGVLTDGLSPQGPGNDDMVVKVDADNDRIYLIAVSESDMRLEPIVHEALDHARDSGFDFTFDDPAEVTMNLMDRDADCEDESPDEIMVHVITWQDKKKTNG